MFNRYWDYNKTNKLDALNILIDQFKKYGWFY